MHVELTQTGAFASVAVSLAEPFDYAVEFSVTPADVLEDSGAATLLDAARFFTVVDRKWFGRFLATVERREFNGIRDLELAYIKWLEDKPHE